MQKMSWKLQDFQGNFKNSRKFKEVQECGHHDFIHAYHHPHSSFPQNRKRAQRKEVFTGMSSEKPEKIYEAQSKHANEAAVDMFVDRSREHARKTKP